MLEEREALAETPPPPPPRPVASERSTPGTAAKQAPYLALNNRPRLSEALRASAAPMPGAKAGRTYLFGGSGNPLYACLEAVRDYDTQMSWRVCRNKLLVRWPQLSLVLPERLRESLPEVVRNEFEECDFFGVIVALEQHALWARGTIADWVANLGPEWDREATIPPSFDEPREATEADLQAFPDRYAAAPTRSILASPSLVRNLFDPASLPPSGNSRRPE